MAETAVNTSEEWRAIAGYEGAYEVSSEGRVRSLSREIRQKSAAGKSFRRKWQGRVLSPAKGRVGYLHVALKKQGSSMQTFTIHRLVCAAFNGPPPSPLHQVGHSNGEHRDNRACNLRWVTPIENAADAKQHGTYRIGTRHPRAKLNDAAIRVIRGSRNNDDLSAAFGVTHSTIEGIRQGRGWPHIS